MTSVGIKNLKNKLSYYLSLVKRGEDILITERGKIIARVIQEDPKKTSVQQALHSLIMKGLIAFPTQELNKDIPEPIEVSGKPISEMIIEDRR
ncbi:MAG: type II toxin-antitoxin system Phd/YefM family antitoxin [bacterium]